MRHLGIFRPYSAHREVSEGLISLKAGWLATGQACSSGKNTIIGSRRTGRRWVTAIIQNSGTLLWTCGNTEMVSCMTTKIMLPDPWVYTLTRECREYTRSYGQDLFAPMIGT